MELTYHIAFGIHMLAVLGILVLLLLQVNKKPKKLNPGIIHASLTAFVSALVMVGLWSQVYPDVEANHAKFGVKTLVVAVILILSIKYKKSEALKNSIWAALLALTTANILLAYLW
jgi:hypothetical protein